MSANPGWYPDPTKTHGLRHWNGSVWTDDVMDHDVQTKSVYDVSSFPAPEAIVVEPNDPTVVEAGASPKHDVPIGMWILLVGLCLCLVAMLATADARRMRLWSEIGAFIAAIGLVAFVILVAALVRQDRRRADTKPTESPRTPRRVLRRRSTQSSAPSPSAWLTEDPPDPTDDIRLETEPTGAEERSPATSSRL